MTAKPIGERLEITAAKDHRGEAERDETSAVDALLRKVDEPRESSPRAPIASPSAVPALRTARVLEWEGRGAKIAYRGSTQGVDAAVASEVDRELVAQAARHGESVLVEWMPNETPVIVGIVQTRIPEQIDLRARVIHLNAEHELLLRAGTGAIRIREDGDVEIVGSRISASSRGLFRLVGRILRLN